MSCTCPRRYEFQTWGPNEYPVALYRYVLEGPDPYGNGGTMYGDAANMLGSLPHDPRNGKILLGRCDPERVIMFVYGRIWAAGKILELSMKKTLISSKDQGDLLYSRYAYVRDGNYWREADSDLLL